MKKLFATVILSLALCVSALAAEPKSLGVRAGAGMALSYQVNMGVGFLETDFGVLGGNMHGLRLAAIYDFRLLTLDWKPCDFTLYMGPGLTGGMYDKGKFAGGMVLQFGCEFSFDKVPVEITFDTCPSFWFLQEGIAADYYSFIPMLGLRWKF